MTADTQAEMPQYLAEIPRTLEKAKGLAERLQALASTIGDLKTLRSWQDRGMVNPENMPHATIRHMVNQETLDNLEQVRHELTEQAKLLLLACTEVMDRTPC